MKKLYGFFAFALLAFAFSSLSLTPASASFLTGAGVSQHDPFSPRSDHAVLTEATAVSFVAILVEPVSTLKRPDNGHADIVTIDCLDFSNASTPEVVALRSGFAGVA